MEGPASRLANIGDRHGRGIVQPANGGAPDDQDFPAMGLLVEGIETVRPPGALPDWQPGAIVRLPYSRKLCGDGAAVCTQALMALADTAMVLACSAAWNGYRPMTSIDQTTHFLRPVNFDVIADARAVRLGRNASFGRGKHLRGAVRERIPRSE